MKTDRLEKFVNENRHEFDQLEPSDKSWEVISQRLNPDSGKKARKFGCCGSNSAGYSARNYLLFKHIRAKAVGPGHSGRSRNS